MKVAEINPYTVMERFPDHKEAIKQLFKSDPLFQTLCSDYRKCAKALLFWNKSGLCEAPQRQREYKKLLSELESEILHYLDKTIDLNAGNISKGE